MNINKIRKTLAKIVAGTGLAGVLAISNAGCSGGFLEDRAKTLIEISDLSIYKEVEIARQRDGISEEGWNYQLRLYEFQHDLRGEWQPPIVTIIKKSGDCEDMATLSAWYSGHIYGENILVVQGERIETKEPLGHAVHLLKKDGKYGSRGNDECDTIPLIYSSLKELIKEIQGRRNKISQDYSYEQLEYKIYGIFNLNDIDKNWRTTRKNLVKGYLDCCRWGKGEGGAIADLE